MSGVRHSVLNVRELSVNTHSMAFDAGLFSVVAGLAVGHRLPVQHFLSNFLEVVPAPNFIERMFAKLCVLGTHLDVVVVVNMTTQFELAVSV